ncbi:MAG: hypothetical protein MUC42_10210, partial [Bryobacter sp.]|nr:hypothetical protein [Bryobacter sp.]
CVELPAFTERQYLQAVERLPEMSAIVYPDEVLTSAEDERGIYLIVEPCDPYAEAVRTAREIGARVCFIEPALGEVPHLPDDYPDSSAIRTLGYKRYVDLYRVEPQPRNDETLAHAARIAWKLQGADPAARTFVVLSLNLLDPVLDAYETPQPEPAVRRTTGDPHLLNLHPECLNEVCVEYPFLQARYEEFRTARERSELIHRGRAQYALLKTAEESYTKNTGDRVLPWQRRLLARYTRNLAMVSGYLSATLFEMAIAARSIVDDNYAWEVWHAGGATPWQKEHAGQETVNLSGDEMWLHTRRIRLRRRLPRPKRLLKPAPVRPRQQEKEPGEWARELHGEAICSYPPEDLVIEDYGRFLKRKAKSLLSEERARVHPFTTSVLDGIDIRETIRNWHQKQIYVREMERMAGEVGSVVVIFDEDRGDRFTYCRTWLGENQNESDMAFYSTAPFEHMVGPGIGRAEYGGLLMTLPPRRMMDVWADPDYDFAESKPERLLMAGLDYSLGRYVVYVAARPPRTIFRSIAGQLGRQIVYIPIGQLNSQQIKKIRVVHVLDSYARRETAKSFLW